MIETNLATILAALALTLAGIGILGAVGVRLLHDALRRQPFLYGLGLGDLEAVITRMVLAMGWQPDEGHSLRF